MEHCESGPAVLHYGGAAPLPRHSNSDNEEKSDLLRDEGFIHTNEDAESDCKWIKHTFEGSVFDGEGVNEMFEKAVSLALEHEETRKGNLRCPAGKKCAVS